MYREKHDKTLFVVCLQAKKNTTAFRKNPVVKYFRR